MPYILGHFIQQKQSIILKRGQRIFGVTIFSQSKHLSCKICGPRSNNFYKQERKIYTSSCVTRPNPSLTLKHTGNASFTKPNIWHKTDVWWSQKTDTLSYYPLKRIYVIQNEHWIIKYQYLQGNPFFIPSLKKKYIFPIRSQKNHQNLRNMSGSQFPHNATVGQAMYRLS